MNKTTAIFLLKLSKDKFITSFDERVNTDIINSNQIQNLYNYIIKIKEKNRALNIKCQGLEMMKNNNDDKNMKHRENEEYIKMILNENK